MKQPRNIRSMLVGEFCAVFTGKHKIMHESEYRKVQKP